MSNDLVQRLVMDTVGFEKGADHARGIAEHLGSELSSMAQEWARMFAAGFGIERGVEAVKGAIEEINSLSHMSERMGVEINDLQALKMEAAHTGVEFEQVGSAITKMDKALGDALEGGDKKNTFRNWAWVWMIWPMRVRSTALRKSAVRSGSSKTL